MKLLSVWALASLALQATAAAITHKLDGRFTITEHPDPEKRALLQKIVTWDPKSLFVHGERIMIFSGEFHPFRLPVPTLYLDVFQKIKALGFNCVSFYIDWALLEGKPGVFRAEGILALEPFFEAASEAGIYLLARPGPYINAEASGGGFPGWLQRVPGILRTAAPDYLAATENYVSNVAKIIAKAQITNGGPVILYQPENEYSGACCGVKFPDPNYMQYVMDQARANGIVVPFISNDAGANGYDVPGSGVGAVDIYGHDGYPLGFDCANPTVWPAGKLQTWLHATHERESPSTPYSIVEFQGGSFDPWGGPGFYACSELLNHEFERVFYKNNLAAGVSFLNLYMIFGGTNWGNLGHPGGYTSYDYGSAITESRNITREKYSELKLIGNFVKASPAYLDAVPGSLSDTAYTDTTDLAVTPLLGNTTASSFFVVRHADYSSQAVTPYQLKVPTSAGNLTLPQLGGHLTLSGRDTKIHVTDYDVGGTTLLYSTAEVLTWKQLAGGAKVLVVYGGAGEHHELAVAAARGARAWVGQGDAKSIVTKVQGGHTVVAWDVSTERRIVHIGDLQIHLLDRNTAYNYWVPECPSGRTTPGFSSRKNTAASLIVKAGYLVRTAFLQGSQVHLTADFNATTPVEVIGAPPGASSLYINGQRTAFRVDRTNGIWSTTVPYAAPRIALPPLASLPWTYADSLPEIQPGYDDGAWVAADHATTNNSHRALTTPTSLYASDYGFHTGALVFRGHFVAAGNETAFAVHTQGGSAFGSSVWLNQTYLGSWTGNDKSADHTANYSLPGPLRKGAAYVLTVLVDNTGLDEDWTIGTETAKNPRGILDYTLAGRDPAAVAWKLTGNLGGEDYVDTVRGPLNEGGLFAERQGWHQPAPPSGRWAAKSPLDGFAGAGVGFYAAPLDLDIPAGWDVPLYFTFGNSTAPPPPYRVQLYVNGYQFGKYANNIGPQTQFPVPQGILNYQGRNWIAVTLWAQQAAGARLDSFALEHGTPVLTALRGVQSVPQPRYQPRPGAY